MRIFDIVVAVMPIVSLCLAVIILAYPMVEDVSPDATQISATIFIAVTLVCLSIAGASRKRKSS